MTRDVPRIAVLFRIHYWDDTVARNYMRLRRHCQNAELWIVPDETAGPLPLSDLHLYFPISRNDVLSLGLPDFPQGKLFWYNNDYGLYLFFLRHPGYDFYILCEHDVVVNLDLAELCQHLSDDGADFAALPNRIGEREWESMPSCTELWKKEEVSPHLLCFAVFSSRSVPLLLAARRDHARRYAAGALRRWPLAEGFVPTQLKQQGLRVVNMDNYAAMDHYDFWPPYHESEAAVLRPGAIVHPVLRGERYARVTLQYDKMPVLSWFRRDSALHQRLALEPLRIIVRPLAEKLARLGMIRELIHLEAMAQAQACPIEPSLLPKFKTGIMQATESRLISASAAAWQSSHSAYSKGASREQDAANLLMGEPDGHYACHTDFELSPWWMLDLADICLVNRLEVFNRLDHERQRADDMSVYISLDGRNWQLVFTKPSGPPLGGKDGHPLSLAWEEPKFLRYARIELGGHTALHLDKVRLYGWELPAEGALKG